MAINASLDAFKEVHNETTIDTSKKFRIGFIGCGWIAGAHLKALKNQPDVEIVAGCDLIPGRLLSSSQTARLRVLRPTTLPTRK